MRTMVGFVAAMVLSACGGAGSVNGTVAGISLSVKDSFFVLLRNTLGETAGMMVMMLDKPDACTTFKANRNPKNSTGVAFSMVRYTDMGKTLAPDVGEYTVVNGQPSRGGNYVAAYFVRTDSNCTSTVSDAARRGSSGVVKLTSLKGEANGYASGTFDVTFGTSDKVTGDFNAKFCDIQQISDNPNCE